MGGNASQPGSEAVGTTSPYPKEPEEPNNVYTISQLLIAGQ